MGPASSTLEGLTSLSFDFTIAMGNRLRVPISCLPIVLIFTFLKPLDPFSNEISGRSTIYKTDKIKVCSVDAGVEGLEHLFAIFILHENYLEGLLKIKLLGPISNFHIR